jgi:multidrug resistance efflux pump
MSRKLIALLVVVVAIVAGGAWFLSGGPGGTTAGGSPAPSLGPVPESDTVASDARAIPVTRVELAAPGAGGVVAEVLVAEGDTVTAGQPLLRLDGTQLEGQVAVAEAAVAAAKAAVDTARAGVTQAQAAVRQAASQVTAANAAVSQAAAGGRAAQANRDQTPAGTKLRRAANAEVDRAWAAYRGAVAQAEAARRAEAAAKAAVATARTEVARARAGVASAEASLAAAKAALDGLVLGSPIAGTVVTLDAVVGETVGPGVPVVRIADPGAWRFETIDLDETSVGRITEGATATISVDAFPDVSIPATVVKIDRFGQPSAGDIVYAVVLEPTGEVPEGLRWNMTASAVIDTGE